MNTITPAEVKIALYDTLGAVFLGHFVTTMCVGYTDFIITHLFLTLTPSKSVWHHFTSGVPLLPRPDKGLAYSPLLCECPWRVMSPSVEQCQFVNKSPTRRS